MSNNIYNILNAFNKVAQEPVKPAPKASAPKSQLQEGMEQVLQRKLIAEKKAVEINTDIDVQSFESVDQIVSSQLVSIESDTYNKSTLLEIYNSL